MRYLKWNRRRLFLGIGSVLRASPGFSLRTLKGTKRNGKKVVFFRSVSWPANVVYSLSADERGSNGMAGPSLRPRNSCVETDCRKADWSAYLTEVVRGGGRHIGTCRLLRHGAKRRA